MYFSATIFALVGFRSPTLAALSIASTNFLFTLVAFYAIDQVGRRRILLLSVPVMTSGLAICAIAFRFLNVHPENDTGAQTQPPGVWPILILISMVVYVAGYATGLGNVPWQQSELFPLPVRSLGSSIATAMNWGSNTLIGLTFLPLMDLLSPPGTFALYTIICVACWIIIWSIYPETAGLSLEEVSGLLKDGWGVQESLRVFKAGRTRAPESGTDRRPD